MQDRNPFIEKGLQKPGTTQEEQTQEPSKETNPFIRKGLQKPGAEIKSDAPFEHAIDWGNVLRNILPNAVQNIKDLSQVANPKTYKALVGLVKETKRYAFRKSDIQIPMEVFRQTGGTGNVQKLIEDNPELAEQYPQLKDFNQEISEDEFPLLYNIQKFYETHYDWSTDEGKARFNKYFEENPVNVLSDFIAIASTGIGGAGSLLKGTKLTTFVSKLHASKYMKPVKVVGRAAEVAIDPGSAAGRFLGDIFKRRVSKSDVIGSSDEITKRRLDMDDDIRDATNQAAKDRAFAKGKYDASQIRGLVAGILDDAYADGFKPDALRNYLNSRRSRGVRSQLPDNVLETLNKYADRFSSKYVKLKGFDDYIREGKDILLPLLGGATGYGLGDWPFLIAGVFGGRVLSGMIEKSPDAVKYIMLNPPPDWAEYVKKASTTAGRVSQRGGRAYERMTVTNGDGWDALRNKNASDPIGRLQRRER